MSLTIKCARCKSKIFKYHKLGQGRVLRCWKKRILKDFSHRRGEDVLCPGCGHLVGLDNRSGYVAMKQNAFIYTGTKE